MDGFSSKSTRQRLFGTDGVRGVANIEPMTVETAVRLGRSAAHVFRRGEHRHRILIGKDTRLSGYMLENALVAGICSMGVDTLLVGPLPTPGIAFATRALRADAGIVISASHNPYMDNGIKFFNCDGFKLPDAIEEEIEDLTFTGRIDDVRPTARAVGKAFRIDDVGSSRSWELRSSRLASSRAGPTSTMAWAPCIRRSPRRASVRSAPTLAFASTATLTDAC